MMYDFEKSESISHYKKIEELQVNNLEQLLEHNYPRINESIIKEEYNRVYNNFDRFIEIIDNSEVIGYITLEKLNISFNHFSINDAYIIPEYRNKKIFTTYLTLLLQQPNMHLFIKKPTIKLVNYLLNNNLAITLTGNLIYSFIGFVIDGHDVFKNKNLKRYYKSIPSPEDNKQFIGTVFDLKLGCFYFVDDDKVFIKKEYPGISMPHPYDLKKYKLRKKLQKINSSDMTKTIKNLRYYEHDVVKYEEAKKDELKQFLSIDNMLGLRDNLNSDYLEFIKMHNLSDEDAVNIYDKISEALDFEEIVPKTIFKRLLYLIEHPKTQALITNTFNHTNCPYCDEELILNQEYCEKCGFNYQIFDDDDELMDMPENNSFEEEDYQEKDVTVNDESIDGDNDDESINQEMDDGHICEHDEEEHYDKHSGLEINLHKQVVDAGLNPNDVFQQQLEAGLYEFLTYIDSDKQKLTIPDYDYEYQIRHGSIIQYALDEKLVVKVEKKLDLNEFERFFSNMNEEDKNQILDELKNEAYYQITDKAKEYLDEKVHLKQFNEYIKYLPYYEYKQLYDKEKHSSIDSLISRYIDIMMFKSVQNNDCTLYIDALYDKVNYYIKNNSMELALTYLLRALICRINYYKQSSLDKYDMIKAIDMRDEIYINLIMKFISTYNTEELYAQAYDGIKIASLKENKEKNRDYIEHIIKEDDIEAVNKYILED